MMSVVFVIFLLVCENVPQSHLHGGSVMCYRVGHLYVAGWVTCVLEVGYFWVRKNSSKHINMGSSFEDLVATSPTVKTDPKTDKRFGLKNF